MRTHQLFRLCTVILTTLTLAALCLYLSDTGASVDNLTQETPARMFYHGLGYTRGMRTIPMGDWSLRDERDELYRNHILVYPSEAYYGDTIYVVVLHQNVSATTSFFVDLPLLDAWNARLNDFYDSWVEFRGEKRPYLFEQGDGRFVLGNDGEYHRQEFMLPGEKTIFGPNDVYVGKVFCFETPPLEEWNDDFWQELRNEVDSNGQATLQLCVKQFETDDMTRLNFSFEKTVTIKKRPDNEMAILQGWRDNTSDEMTPGVSERHNCKYRRPIDNESSFDVAVDTSGRRNKIFHFPSACSHTGKSLPPQTLVPIRNVVRAGNRKPYLPNTPDTLDGWFDLENQFSESTIKDEIHLTTALIEYYAARETNAPDLAAKRDAIVAWLDQLPDAQKIALSFFVGDRFYEFQQYFKTINVKLSLDDVK